MPDFTGATLRTSPPSAVMVKMPPPSRSEKNASRWPSGDHAGNPSTPGKLDVKLMGVAPDGSQIQTSSLPARSETYAIRLPVGLQDGCFSMASLARNGTVAPVAGLDVGEASRPRFLGQSPQTASVNAPTATGTPIQPQRNRPAGRGAGGAVDDGVPASVSRPNARSRADWNLDSGAFSRQCVTMRWSVGASAG